MIYKEHLMNLHSLITTMQSHAETIRSLTANISGDQARWKPSAETWSLIEVICHLYDEEREDFRVRLDYILHKPGETWPKIDPQGWIKDRDYASRDLVAVIAQWSAERENSIAWFKTLESANWDQAAIAPWGGELRAGDMLASWVAHDMLHMRQLVELHWAWHQHVIDPYSSGYAGDW
jgi:hypothetical protein